MSLITQSRLRRRAVDRLESARARSTSTRSASGPTRPARPSSGSARQCFGIYEPTTFGLEFAPQTTAHLALHVDDVATARAELEAKGVEFLGETFDTGVCHMAFFERSRRQRADAPPPLQAARGAGRVVITVERSDFVSVPVTDLERSIALLRRDARASAQRPRRRAGRSSSSARTSRCTSSTRPTSAASSTGPHTSPIALRVPDVEDGEARARGEGRRVRRRDVRHGRLPHGDLPRPRRQRADAPPEVRTP